jgi:energy-coupling factor transport system ATP-binding protein
MEIFTVENLSFSYPLCGKKALNDVSFTVDKGDFVAFSDKKALDDVSFTVSKGDFVAVCGATGSGKSTTLRLMKRELSLPGELSGTVKYNGIPLEALDAYVSACKIGFVMQRPEQQIVTDKVWHELAFGLENMGLPNGVIRRRVSETACYFGIEDWFDKNVSELSGGQKQLLNLASVMVMQPDVILLDEPTSQLDPIAASDFIATLTKLNRELSLTVIIVEHRLEDIIPVSDKLLALENGKLIAYGGTREIVGKLRAYPSLLEGMPSAVRLYSRFDIASPCPLSIREGRQFIEDNFENKTRSIDIPEYTHSKSIALGFSEVFFRYSRTLPDVLRGLTFSVYEGEIFCILGGNGSGKTTSLGAAAGLNKIYSGNITIFGKSSATIKTSHFTGNASHCCRRMSKPFS